MGGHNNLKRGHNLSKRSGRRAPKNLNLLQSASKKKSFQDRRWNENKYNAFKKYLFNTESKLTYTMGTAHALPLYYPNVNFNVNRASY